MRELKQIFDAQPTRDGDGVKIKRLGGRHLNVAMDPFLMIDEIVSDDAADYIGGFPSHPHRGFETISYMKAGRMRHRDHMGNEGVIAAGDVQWMTAGVGVLHSEMPEQEQGLLHGFQIWLNLPAAEKMRPAAYRDIASADIAEQLLPGGGVVRVIAGLVDVAVETSEGGEDYSLSGPLPSLSTEPVLIDLQLAPNESVSLGFNADYPALSYLYRGQVDSQQAGQMAVYSAGEGLRIVAGAAGADMLLLSGRPLAEPIAQYGPFVMNTAEELAQAVTDFNDEAFVGELTPYSKPLNSCD